MIADVLFVPHLVPVLHLAPEPFFNNDNDGDNDNDNDNNDNNDKNRAANPQA